MGLPDQVVVLLCILAAAGAVCVGFAFQRLFGRGDLDEGGFNHKKPEQEAYMREVRSRNMVMAFGDIRPPHHHPREI
ncbi:uncharacterized protein A1O5_09953 [Cladophialophora psammophila CBS 110553]|uniref:Uncharacterized protein n=1 Tax=Cladophialophora psammophila CBS 110553 TaxID=1182543 RepID=W9WFM8_9EURO|nr:uncharacterized protein A1O5_09953 [Cladophialophora psammophila CBS 110553]EXJ66758.1 hypothetical protein A1O5_09953 [Cladophialophora psammophila CBS 110553]